MVSKIPSKKCLIIGANGQDGLLLAEYLLSLKYDLIYIIKNYVIINNIKNPFSILSQSDVNNLIKNEVFDKIFYLAAYHGSSEDKIEDDNLISYNKFHDVNVCGFINFLYAIKKFSPITKIFYASSSLIFDGNSEIKLSENSSFNPDSFYGITKLSGLQLCRLFRNKYKIWATCGILFSHESILRSKNYLSKKLLESAYNISLGIQDNVTVGNLSFINDWGYAGDYVVAMNLALDASADDFIISSGEGHTVKEFTNLIFYNFNLDYKKFIIEDNNLIIRENKIRIGDYTKLFKATGWIPKHSFIDMIKKLVDEYILEKKYEVQYNNNSKE